MPYSNYARLYELTQGGRASKSILIYAPPGKSSGYWQTDGAGFRDTAEHNQFISKFGTGQTYFYNDIGLDNSGYTIDFSNAPFESRAFVLNGLIIMGRPKMGTKGNGLVFQVSHDFDVNVPITWEFKGTKQAEWHITEDQKNGKGSL